MRLKCLIGAPIKDERDNLYWMRRYIFSQCKYRRMGEILLKRGVFETVGLRAAELRINNIEGVQVESEEG